MIKTDEIISIGKFGHPHGINGEISAYIDIPVDLACLRCIMANVDGIIVPFFIKSIRPKGTNATLLTLDDINNEQAASEFVGKTIYALRSECKTEEEDDSEDDRLFAEDLIGYRIVDTTEKLNGTIDDIDDTTENVLFIVNDPSVTRSILVPVANEFIEDIDPENKILTVDLPTGFLDI